MVFRFSVGSGFRVLRWCGWSCYTDVMTENENNISIADAPSNGMVVPRREQLEAERAVLRECSGPRVKDRLAGIAEELS